MVDRGLFDDQKGISHGLDSRIPSREGSRVLPVGYVPGEWDVICHSSKETQDHIGNRRFDLCVENYIETYKNAKSRVEKSAVISNIVGSIRESSTTGGGFVRFDMRIERWCEVGDKIARDKVGQSLRAHNSNNKKSSPDKKKETTTHRAPTVVPRVSSEPSPHALLPDTTADWTQVALLSNAFPLRRDQAALSTTAVVPPQQPPEENTFDMMRQTTNTQDNKKKGSDNSDDSPSDNSLMAWFEADAKGTT